MSKIFKFNFQGYGKKSQNVISTVERLKKKEITIEEILIQDDLVIELNLQSNSALSEQ